MYLQRYSDALMTASPAEKDRLLLICTMNVYCFIRVALHTFKIHSISLEVPVVMLLVKQTFIWNLNFLLQYFIWFSPCFFGNADCP